MSGITVNYGVLNQKATPAFFADTLANRPAFGVVGRVFISTDTLDLYRDTGTSWVLLSPSSTGTITGTGAAGQVTYFTGTTSIGGNNNLFWDSVNFRLGINTAAPGAPLDVHGSNAIGNFQLNTTSLQDNNINYLSQGTSKWRVGISYNAGANDYQIYDAANLLQRFSIRNTGQVTVGTQVSTSGSFVVNNATSDNHIVIIGANGPSLRINNSGTGATQLLGIGLSTATNNFIQGSASGNMCIFNGSTTASPILVGIYNAGNVVEVARWSASYNYLIGSSTDTGEKLQVTGTAKVTSSITAGSIIKSGGTSAQFLMADGSVSAGGGAAAGTNIGLLPSGSQPQSILFYLSNPYYWNGYYNSAGQQSSMYAPSSTPYNQYYISPYPSASFNYASWCGVINSGTGLGLIPLSTNTSSTQGQQAGTFIEFTGNYSSWSNVEYPEFAITNVRNYQSLTTTENTQYTNNTLMQSVWISFLRKGNSGGFCWYLFNGGAAGTRYYDTSKSSSSTSMQCFDMPCIGRYNGTFVYLFFDRTAFAWIYSTNGTSYTNCTGSTPSSATYPHATSAQYDLGSGNCLDVYAFSPFGGTSYYYSTTGGQSWSLYNLPTAPPVTSSQYYYHALDYNGVPATPKWAYCGANGTLYYATNLSTGFTASATTAVGQRNIFYVNGNFFALPINTSSTLIYYSSDAITWNSITVANGKYQAVVYMSASSQYFFISGDSSTNTHYCSNTFTGVSSIVSSTAGAAFQSPYSYTCSYIQTGVTFGYVSSSGDFLYYPGTGTSFTIISPTAAARQVGTPITVYPNTVQYLYQKMN